MRTKTLPSPAARASEVIASSAGLAAIPQGPSEALQQAKRALEVAKRLVKEHKKNPKNDPIKARLRAGAELGWLAALSACQAILAHHRRIPTGNARDVDRAEEVTEENGTQEEKAMVEKADRARDKLHADCFYRGDCAAPSVEKTLDQLQNAIDGLAYHED